MRGSRPWTASLLALLVLTPACRSEGGRSSTAEEPVSEASGSGKRPTAADRDAAGATAADGAGEHSPEPAATAESSDGAEGASSTVPRERLAELDGRRPVPLLPMMAHHQKTNMRDHLDAVRGIVGALAEEDWKRLEKQAGRIGSSKRMQQMCQHMGAGADGFTKRALGFHRKADGIAEAAREQDRKAALEALQETLQTCVGCHAEYKQNVVGKQEWQQRTGAQAPNPSRMHQHGGGP